MNSDNINDSKDRLMSEFFGMCAAFNIDNCSIDDLVEELSKDNKSEEKDKTLKKIYPK